MIDTATLLGAALDTAARLAGDASAGLVAGPFLYLLTAAAVLLAAMAGVAFTRRRRVA
jgi:hypothetical protein